MLWLKIIHVKGPQVVTAGTNPYHLIISVQKEYRQISNTSPIKSRHLNVSRLVLQNFVFAQSIEAGC